MCVGFSSPVLVADAADARRHESQKSSANNGISFATPACAAACAVVARSWSAAVCGPPATATAASTASTSTSPGASSFELAIFRRAAAWPLGWLGCHPKTLPLHWILLPWVAILQFRGNPLLHLASLCFQSIGVLGISSCLEKAPVQNILHVNPSHLVCGKEEHQDTENKNSLYLHHWNLWCQWPALSAQSLLVKKAKNVWVSSSAHCDPLANPHELPCERLSWLPDDCLALSLAPLYQGVNFLWEFRILWNPGGYEQGKMRNDWKTFIVFFASLLNTQYSYVMVY